MLSHFISYDHKPIIEGRPESPIQRGYIYDRKRPKSMANFYLKLGKYSSQCEILAQSKQSRH